jgi:quercetin dioxygenase-like cupin family protein
MTGKPSNPIQNPAKLPPDDPTRKLVHARSDDQNQNTPHIGLVGDTYTILLKGKDTAGRYCLIDMYIPPGGGPPPHRHDFEESFAVLEGEIEATFRGVKSVVRAGETIHIPANAPHQFHNWTQLPARLLCVCSPAGQEDFFLEVGVTVATRTTAPPKLDPAAQAAFKAKSESLAPKYKTELLPHA